MQGSGEPVRSAADHCVWGQGHSAKSGLVRPIPGVLQGANLAGWQNRSGGRVPAGSLALDFYVHIRKG